jgi:decaprenyl-phosphate phosphoribosyltransferase
MKAAPVRENSASAAGALSKLNVSSPSIRGHVEIARIDHWIKNVFVLPGIVVALSVDHTQLTYGLWARIIVGLL